VHGVRVCQTQFESGVHRVQRVPTPKPPPHPYFRRHGRVLPEVEDVDIKIADDDLKIDTMRAQGAGVSTSTRPNRHPHHPSAGGIVVFVQEERSQHKNKAKALKMLRAKL